MKKYYNEKYDKIDCITVISKLLVLPLYNEIFTITLRGPKPLIQVQEEQGTGDPCNPTGIIPVYTRERTMN